LSGLTGLASLRSLVALIGRRILLRCVLPAARTALLRLRALVLVAIRLRALRVLPGRLRLRLRG
jgi:hypothetical protein